MKNLLPLPSINYVPKVFSESDDMIALCDFLDTEITQWYNDSKNLEKLKDPARCPESCLQAFGDWIGADVRNEDSEAVKRGKIANSVKVIKLRGTWENSVKKIIDNRIGGDSELLSYIGSDDFIICGSGDEPDSYYWSIMGGAGDSDSYGVLITGGSDEDYWEKGAVAIDINSSSATSSTISALVTDLIDVVPCYFRIYLGYVQDNKFVIYDNGIIG